MDNASDVRESHYIFAENSCQHFSGWIALLHYEQFGDYCFGQGCDWYELYKEPGRPLYLKMYYSS